MAGTVSTRGQITIDLELRRELSIEPGMVAHQRVVDGRLEVVFLPAPHTRSLAGMLHRPGDNEAVLTGEELEEAAMLGLAADEQRDE
jgi:hypothetical protein